MTEPTQEVKKEYDYSYQVDQQVSVNAFLDVVINGEAVRFQITSRYGATAEKIVKTTEAAMTAYSMLRAMYPKQETQPAPAPVQAPAPQGNTLSIAKIKVTPEVKDGKPRIKVELFEDGHQYSDVNAFYNDAGQASAAFSEVTGLDFSVAGEYTIKCIAHYRLSEKTNKNGKPYKNLVGISAV